MAGSAHAAQAAIANAIKASGVLVRLEPAQWMAILKRIDAPLVVVAMGGVFRKHHKYLTAYRGLAFYTKSPDALVLPGRVEIITAKSMAIPETY